MRASTIRLLRAFTATSIAALAGAVVVTAYAGSGAKLGGESSLAEWKKATPSERSRVAVEIARGKLPPTATRLEVATAAMEITGCVTKTAGDPRFESWKVAGTAQTCLSAPEKPAK